MAQFYADENFPRPVIVALRELGHDVLTAYEDGRANKKIPDEEVLSRATELGRAVLSKNRDDFAQLHKNQPEHEGIILCKQEVDSIGQAQRIHEEVQSSLPLTGKLLRIKKPPPSTKEKVA